MGTRFDPTDPMQYAAVIAHQLKTPVSAVASLLKVLLGEFAGPLTPKQKELLEKAILRCDESIQTAQQLLSIARAIHNPDSLRGNTSLVKAVEQAAGRYHDLARSHHIHLNLHNNTMSGQDWVKSHEPALIEAIEALINNALKYTPDHGHIDVVVEYTESSERIRLRVGDSGPGIAESERDLVLMPFFRSQSSSNAARTGSGLGLAFVKAVIDAAGGTIEVDRSRYGGAEFIIQFPVIKPSHIQKSGDMPMAQRLKVIIVGGVAAGPKVAAKIIRLIPEADVTIIEKGKLLSYAGCGLPYYISGEVKNQYELMSSSAGIVRDPVFFQKVKNVHIMNQTEALEIDRAHKRILVRDYVSKKETWLDYDKLVLATGARPVMPDIEGLRLRNVFTLWGVADAEGIKTELERGRAHDVVILGGGLVGIEVTEALARKGCRVSIVEKRSQILRILDDQIARLVENYLEAHGVKVLTQTETKRLIGGDQVEAVATSRGILPADMVILSTGVRPNSELARQAGLELGKTGGIKVDAQLRTSDPDIFAAGDCVESIHLISGQGCHIPLGSTANKQGRVVAVNVCGGDKAYRGVIGSIGCKVFDYEIARTGFTEREARERGYDTITVLNPAPDREHFAPGAATIKLKLVVDKASRRLLGAQAVGPGSAVARVNLAALAITNHMTVDDMSNLDLCYAPSFSPVMDNLITATNIACNKLDGYLKGIGAAELYDLIRSGADMILLDVRTAMEVEHNHLPYVRNIPLGVLRERANELDGNKLIVTLCNSGLRAYEASLILDAAGFDQVRVLEGGLEMWPYDTLIG